MLCATPPFAHTHFFLGIQKILIQGNLNDVSKEFLGNHQIPTPVKRYFQVNGHGVQGRVLRFRVGDVDDDVDDDDDDGVTFNAQVAKLRVAR